MAAVGMLTVACSDDLGFLDNNNLGMIPKDGLAMHPNLAGNSEDGAFTTRFTEAVSSQTDYETKFKTVDTENADNNANEAFRETFMGENIDVFLHGTSTNVAGDWFCLHYPNTVIDQSDHLLATNWKDVRDITGTKKLIAGEKYDVYVAMNNPHTQGEVASLDALKALNTPYDLKIFGIQQLEGENVPTGNFINIVNSETFAPVSTQNGSPYSYTANDQATGAYIHIPYTSPRTFLMDGFTKDWTPEKGVEKQIIPVDMKRAAAKIILNVRFSDNATEDPVSVVEESLADDGVTIIHGETKTVSFQERLRDYDKMKVGMARWKYVNFPVTTTDFADGVLPAGVELTQRTSSSALNPYRVFGETTTENGITSIPVTVEYGIGTYCYSIDWESPANAVDEAPAILLSMAYYAPQELTKFTDNPTYSNTDYTVNYYRIPIVDEETVTKIERNHIYRIDAVITGYGSTSENLPETAKDVKLKYHVLEWNEKESAESNGYLISVQTSTQYFLVTDRSEIEMYGPLGGGSRSEDVKLYYPQNTEEVEFRVKAEIVSQSGNTATAISASPHYYDKNGDAARIPATYTPTLNNGYITGGSGSASKVTSPVMAEPYNATKYWTVRYTLEKRQKSGNTWGNWESANISRDVTFKHYPVDNIQNFTGSWSSRWDGVSGGTTTVREYSWNPSADGWETGSYQTETVIVDTYIEGVTSKIAVTPTTAGAHRENYENNDVARSTFTSAVPNREDRWNAEDEDNAVQGNDGYWYWGTQPRHGMGSSGNASINDYDYFRDPLIGGRQYYILTNVRRAKYYIYQRIRYYRDVPSETEASTGNWVDWDTDANKTLNPRKYTADGDYNDNLFQAKVFDNNNIYGIDVSNRYYYSRATNQTAGTWTSYTTDNQREDLRSGMTSLNNNHMYVIQLTATSNEYALGKPTLRGDHMSDDHVVSPAFMLASQLGATLQPGDKNIAADHCATYMEVGTLDGQGEQGKRFTGWRLPTREEIGIIIKYQDALETMATVLSGDHYWTLEGKAVATNWYKDGNNYYRMDDPAYSWYSWYDPDASNRYKYITNDGTTGAVRCVRDLDPDDLESLNSRK